MPVLAPEKIYQPSDLNQRYRAVLDAAHSGGVRVRDTDGTSLVIVPEGDVQSLDLVVSALANYLQIANALREGRAPTLAEFGEWSWLRGLSEDDQHEFMVEMNDILLAAARECDFSLASRTLHDWRETARALADEQRYAVLMGEPTADDFVEVQRPDEVSAEDRASAEPAV